MPQGYGYGNARLRARRSRFMTEADYRDLLARTTIEAVIARLGETPYKEDIEAALIRTSGVDCVEEAVKLNLTRSLRQLRSFYEGDAAALIDLLLRRWDRHNLITILRGQRQGGPAEAMLAAVVPVGQLDEVALHELARQPGLRATIDLMTVWQLPYARPLRQVQARRGAIPDLDQLELALDRFHYTSLGDALGQGNGNRAIVRDYFEVEVDLRNLRIALKLARRPELIPLILQRYQAADVRPLLIEFGGRVSTDRLATLLHDGGNLEMLVQALRDGPYGSALAEGWQRYQAGENGLSIFEHVLERWQAAYVKAMFSRNALSIAIPIGYLSGKEIEAANVRLIAHAVTLRMPTERVRRDLIIL